jgi:hypothetical protein
MKLWRIEWSNGALTSRRLSKGHSVVAEVVRDLRVAGKFLFWRGDKTNMVLGLILLLAKLLTGWFVGQDRKLGRDGRQRTACPGQVKEACKGGPGIRISSCRAIPGDHLSRKAANKQLPQRGGPEWVASPET